MFANNLLKQRCENKQKVRIITEQITQNIIHLKKDMKNYSVNGKRVWVCECEKIATMGNNKQRFLPNTQCQINQTIRISSFVVVPSNNFDHVANDRSQTAVENTRMWITNDINRNDWIVRVTQNAL